MPRVTRPVVTRFIAVSRIIPKFATKTVLATRKLVEAAPIPLSRVVTAAKVQGGTPAAGGVTRRVNTYGRR